MSNRPWLWLYMITGKILKKSGIQGNNNCVGG